MIQYVDMRLLLDLKNIEKSKMMIEETAKLGYNFVGIPMQNSISLKKILAFKKKFLSYGIDLVSRIDLEPTNTSSLLKSLRKTRDKFEIISVRCSSKATSRLAARDRRVDLISFPLIDRRKRFFDYSGAKLASNALTALEIDLSQILLSRGVPRIHLLKFLREESQIAIKYDVPLILSSGAKYFHMLRSPTDLSSLSYLFGLDSESAKQAISGVPKAVIEKNRRKLNPNFIAPDVYLVRKGRDCQD